MMGSSCRLDEMSTSVSSVLRRLSLRRKEDDAARQARDAELKYVTALKRSDELKRRRSSLDVCSGIDCSSAMCIQHPYRTLFTEPPHSLQLGASGRLSWMPNGESWRRMRTKLGKLSRIKTRN